jgi:hypothetical protein
MSRPEAMTYFNAPVDADALGIPLYKTIIKVRNLLRACRVSPLDCVLLVRSATPACRPWLVAVQKPMDLGTINTKLKAKGYSSAERIFADMQLVRPPLCIHPL